MDNYITFPKYFNLYYRKSGQLSENGLVLNLKDKEGNLSGKGFNWSLFGVLDGENESKNAEVFKRIVEDMKAGTTAGQALGKEYLNLTKSGQEFARELVHSKKPLNETMQGFTAASQSASKLTLASKATTLGMKALSFAIEKALSLTN